MYFQCFVDILTSGMFKNNSCHFKWCNTNVYKIISQKYDIFTVFLWYLLQWIPVYPLIKTKTKNTTLVGIFSKFRKILERGQIDDTPNAWPLVR